MPPDLCPACATNGPGTRRLVVRLVMLFYVALLSEGILRKWLLPGASDALVFLRDPIMAAILIAYLWHGPSPSARRAFAALFVVVVVFLLCAGCQAATADVSGLVLLLGMRNYWFFVPLAFVMHDVLTPRDYRNWVRLNLLLAVPIAGLVLIQYRSSPGASINVAPGGSNDGVFLLVEDVVRPYGVFSFALGHSAFAAWMGGVALAGLTTATRAGAADRMLVGCGSIAIALMGVLSGSRTYFVLMLSVVVTFGFVAVICGPPRLKAMGASATVTLAGAAAGALALVPSLYENLLERQDAAATIEGSTLERLMRVLTDFSNEVSRVPVFGFGLGSGTNIANFLMNGRTDYVLAEYELTRIVQELGPLFGLFYIATRWAFLAGLVWRAGRAAARGNLQPACFLGFLVPVLLAHDITLQNTMIGIGWFAVGIALAAERADEPVTLQGSGSRVRVRLATQESFA